MSMPVCTNIQKWRFFKSYVALERLEKYKTKIDNFQNFSNICYQH